MPKGNMFDNDAPLIFPKNDQKNSYLLGYINSKLVTYIISCLNPTVKTQVGDVKRIPYSIPPGGLVKQVSRLTERNVEIKTELTKSSLIEVNFKYSPFKKDSGIYEFFDVVNNLITQTIINETIINAKIFEVYKNI